MNSKFLNGLKICKHSNMIMLIIPEDPAFSIGADHFSNSNHSNWENFVIINKTYFESSFFSLLKGLLVLSYWMLYLIEIRLIKMCTPLLKVGSSGIILKFFK
jgi:hypothetical protein